MYVNLPSHPLLAWHARAFVWLLWLCVSVCVVRVYVGDCVRQMSLCVCVGRSGERKTVVMSVSMRAPVCVCEREREILWMWGV